MNLYANASLVGMDSCGEGPAGVRIEVTPEFCETVRKLAKLVVDNDAYCIEKFNQDAEWLADIPSDYLNDENDSEIPVYSERLDCPTLKVTDKEFWFECYLGKSEIVIKSDLIMVSKLEEFDRSLKREMS
jgi:hypothetical protein